MRAGGRFDPSSRRSLDALERATGLVIGRADVTPLPDDWRNVPPRAALEDVIIEALKRPPCAISFSGGRDSSAVLALAAHVARREQLPLPIPISLVFPDCATADEHEWQQLVVDHLRLPDWQKVMLHDEMDIVGPISAPILLKHGTQRPFNAYFHAPIFELARGGSVLTGVGGDEILSSGWSWLRENLVLSRRARPLPLDALRILVAVSPPRVRSAWLSARARAQTRGEPDTGPKWLRPHVRQQIDAARLAVRSHESLSYRRSVEQTLWKLKSRLVGEAWLRQLAADYDVRVSSPLTDARFVAALVGSRRWRMYASRTEAMEELFGDLVPTSLASRPTKAWFDTAFFNRHARAFAAGWTGNGIDPEYLDVEMLKTMWTDETAELDARTFVLLQEAWLADQHGH